MNPKEKFYLTTPIYYVNAKPHLGHAYTTLIADVVARFQKLRGKEVFFATGTDEHGDKVAKKAKEKGLTPQDFCNKISSQFQKTWKSLNVSYDKFIRTTDQGHKESVLKAINQMKKKGDIYQGFYEGYYCVDCENFVLAKDLAPGKVCPDHKKVLKKIKEKNYFFNLKKYLPIVKKKIQEDVLMVRPQKRRNEILKMIERGLPDLSLSREKVFWGIELPFDRSQKIYVWVDALLNYLSVLNFGTNNKELMDQFWPADLQIIGKEIIKFHAIFWPAMLMSLDLPLPKKIFANGFFTIDGQKMSKTIGNIIDPKSLINKWGVDGARFLILTQFSFGEDGDISLEKLEKQYKAKLANELGNLVQRVLIMTKKNQVAFTTIQGNPFTQNKKEGFKVKLNFQDKKECLFLEKIQKKVIESLENLAILEAQETIWTLVNKSNQLIEQKKPWELAKTDFKKCQQILQTLLVRIVLIALLLEPFMPETSKEIIRQIVQNDPKPIFKKM